MAIGQYNTNEILLLVPRSTASTARIQRMEIGELVLPMVVLDHAPPQDTATRWTKSIRKYEFDAAKGSNKVNNYPMLGFVFHDYAMLEDINLFYPGDQEE